MASSDRAQQATGLYRAFADGDREFVERPWRTSSPSPAHSTSVWTGRDISSVAGPARGEDSGSISCASSRATMR